MKLIKTTKRLILFGVLLFTISAYAQENPHLYSTGRVLEVDRCASAWLIKRFIDKKAEFMFFPDGELITKGIPFDTPDAVLTRTHNLSAFEVIIKKYKIEDKAVIELAGLVHELEVNYWGNKKHERAMQLDQALKKIKEETEDNHKRLDMYFKFLDDWVGKEKK